MSGPHASSRHGRSLWRTTERYCPRLPRTRLQRFTLRCLQPLLAPTQKFYLIVVQVNTSYSPSIRHCYRKEMAPSGTLVRTPNETRQRICACGACGTPGPRRTSTCGPNVQNSYLDTRGEARKGRTVSVIPIAISNVSSDRVCLLENVRPDK